MIEHESTLTIQERRRLYEERQAALDLKNKRLGMTIFQISWIMVFLCLIVVNWQLRFTNPNWLKPDALLPSIGTIALLLSVIQTRSGLKSIEAGKRGRFASQWMIAIVLGILFLGIMAQQFVAVTFDGSQFSSVFHLMVAYHAFHAIVVGMMMMIVRRNGLRGDYRDGHTWSVEGTAKLWYFVFVAWILFYIVLYWI